MARCLVWASRTSVWQLAATDSFWAGQAKLEWPYELLFAVCVGILAEDLETKESWSELCHLKWKVGRRSQCHCGGALARSPFINPGLCQPTPGLLWRSQCPGVAHWGHHRLEESTLESVARITCLVTTWPLFPCISCRFESSSHAISMSAYLREQRRELYSRSGELQGGWSNFGGKISFLEEDLKYAACEVQVWIHRLLSRGKGLKTW